jgi:hypothetical protein
MNTKNTQSQPQSLALHSSEGKSWTLNGEPLDGVQSVAALLKAIAKAKQPVTKLVIGNLEKDKRASLQLPAEFAEHLATSFPALTHLHLWGIDDLPGLTTLPDTLQELDVRNCQAFAQLPMLPATLVVLSLEGLPGLAGLTLPSGKFEALVDLSLRGCSNLPERDINAVLTKAPILELLDLSECSVEHVVGQGTANWPSTKLCDIRLNDCQNLASVPKNWPFPLRRLEIQNNNKLSEIPPLVDTKFDYLNLQNASVLTIGVEKLGRPRTLILYGSAIGINKELKGASENENVAKAVYTELDARVQGTVEELELKVIVLGNGCSGKTSLVKTWRYGTELFDKDIQSTHGILLWNKDLPIQLEGKSKTAKLSIWDFAGQDLYHNTHRLFLQSRAIYLICDTEHGDGADAEHDTIHKNGLADGEDSVHPVSYWRDYVASLQERGTNTVPPMAFVKTKVDRKDKPTRVIEGHEGLPAFAVSACTAKGLEDLEKWIRTEAENLFADSEQRQISQAIYNIKQAIQPLINANNKKYDEAYAAMKPGDHYEPVDSPNPWLTRKEFDEEVRKHAHNTPYANDPDSVLTLLHRSSFLYYNNQYLKDYVMLDQRWAVAGIYAVLRPNGGAWINLKARGGRFTHADLRDWVWDKAGYKAEHQKMFIEFMRACEICFEFKSDYETRSRETEYLVPAALPKEPQKRQEAIETRGLANQVGEPLAIGTSTEKLSRVDVVKLLVALGKEWRTFGLFWQWGGQFVSFGKGGNSSTYVHFDWQPHSPGSFAGTLMVKQYGPDTAFTDKVLDVCREELWGRRFKVPTVRYEVVASFSYERDQTEVKEVSFSREMENVTDENRRQSINAKEETTILGGIAGGISLFSSKFFKIFRTLLGSPVEDSRSRYEENKEVTEAILAAHYDLRHSSMRMRDLKEEHLPARTKAEEVAKTSLERAERAITVGISFAGDAPDEFPSFDGDWRQLPTGSKERWPLALRSALRAKHFKVEDYRVEQSRPQHEKQQARKAYLDMLTDADFIVVILSDKYLKSQWCMYELWRIRGRMSKAEGDSQRYDVPTQDEKLLRIGALGDASKIKSSSNNGAEARTAFRKHWVAERQGFMGIVKKSVVTDENDVHALIVAEEAYPFYEWYRFVANSPALETLANAFMNKWSLVELGADVAEIELEKWVSEITQLCDLPEKLLDSCLYVYQKSVAEKNLSKKAALLSRSKELFMAAMRAAPDFVDMKTALSHSLAHVSEELDTLRLKLADEIASRNKP